MFDEVFFQVLSFGFVILGIGVILLVALPTIFFMDRIWPSRPYAVREWEHMVALLIVVVIVVAVSRTLRG